MLVWSQVGDTESFAIKQDEEEYHFELGELLSEDTTVFDFIRMCLSAIAKRKVLKLSKIELTKKASRVFVGIEDSFSVGNCSLGTKKFISRHNIDTERIGGLRGDVLLELEDSSFTRKIVTFRIAQAA